MLSEIEKSTTQLGISMIKINIKVNTKNAKNISDMGLLPFPPSAAIFNSEQVNR